MDRIQNRHPSERVLTTVVVNGNGYILDAGPNTLTRVYRDGEVIAGALGSAISDLAFLGTNAAKENI